MADWIDNYGDFFLSEQEIDRLFRMYDEHVVSQQYLMTLFDLDYGVYAQKLERKLDEIRDVINEDAEQRS